MYPDSYIIHVLASTYKMAGINMSDFLSFIGEQLREEDVEGLSFILEGFSGNCSQNFSYRMFNDGSRSKHFLGLGKYTS